MNAHQIMYSCTGTEPPLSVWMSRAGDQQLSRSDRRSVIYEVMLIPTQSFSLNPLSIDFVSIPCGAECNTFFVSLLKIYKVLVDSTQGVLIRS